MDNRISNYVDQNLKLIRWAILGIGIAGVTLIVKNTHMMSTFSRASSVPESFIDKQISLYGKLMSVDQSGFLNVAHTPAVSSSWFSRRKDEDSHLKIKLVGVGHTDRSLQWLRQNLVGRRVFFKMLAREDPDILMCIVKMQRYGVLNINLNVYLVKNGYATFVPSPVLTGNTSYDALSQQLRRMEIEASGKTGFFGWLWRLWVGK
ncbi:hypothetical protein RvY_09629 [Ramazzottius varieornatus]|uniref:TNase-like domain-containing protein n=1 Tax=Ramazzottius varieornatus TaxID=947166 RepID=A0A1D1VA12_RAMVA|nr:hypothetical protein RvY_09629 [Ramazzottius varieornatus]